MDPSARLIRPPCGHPGTGTVVAELDPPAGVSTAEDVVDADAPAVWPCDASFSSGCHSPKACIRSATFFSLMLRFIFARASTPAAGVGVWRLLSTVFTRRTRFFGAPGALTVDPLPVVAAGAGSGWPGAAEGAPGSSVAETPSVRFQPPASNIGRNSAFVDPTVS